MIKKYKTWCENGDAQYVANAIGEAVIYDSVEGVYYTETEYYKEMQKGASLFGEKYTKEDWERFKEEEKLASINTWYYPK